MTQPPDGWTSPSAPPPGWTSPSAPSPATPPPPPPGYAAYPPPTGSWDVKPGIVPLRPLGVGEILDGAITAMRRVPSVLGVSALIAVVDALATFALQAGTLRTSSTDTASGSEVLGSLVGSLGILALQSIGTLLLSAFAAVIVRDGVLGKKTTMSTAWAEVRPRLGVVIGAGLLGTLAWLGASITLIGIPFGIYLYVAFRFATIVAVVEGGTARGALGRSRRLVRGTWWRVFGVLLLISLVGSLVSLVLVLPFTVIVGGTALFTGTTTLSVGALAISAIGQMIASTLVTPFYALGAGILYVDLRMRTEGLDVALRQAAANPS